MELAGSGATQSPTVSQLGRMLSCQMIVSNGWDLQLGDIRGAFLEADALDRKKGSLYSSLPPGEIPRSAGWSGDSHSWKHLWFERCASTLVEKFDAVMTSTRFHTKHI